ncbi:phage tail termination protein [Serratia liquefaciens]|uniref:phage tail termination protein n=1 Tax=Serratia liquefaciens TaxID=614 RepID=UPI000D521E61|nr:hypothetical protein [Serratia liquefaciens]PVD44531.1 hypothetical protein C5188_08790 [Serratia liquefaciens]QHT50836.1 hypothetical protein C5686_011075 [Serratia liquefaciens]RYM87974.1 hypothetical protein BSR02_05685 [Serratia liquefaciens]
MTPPMYLRLRDHFEDAGLTAGLTIQILMWNDTGKPSDAFIVFRSGGGSDVQHDRGGDFFVMVDVIGAKGKNTVADAVANRIAEFISDQEGADSCVGAMRLLGGVPAPIPSAEGRLIYRLMVCCTYGE